MTLKRMEENDTSLLVVLITPVMQDSAKLDKQPPIQITLVKSSFNICKMNYILYDMAHKS